MAGLDKTQVLSVQDMRRYSAQLSDKSNDLRKMFSELCSYVDENNANWRDEQSVKFVSLLGQQQEEIQKMSAIMDKYSDYIKRLTDRIEILINEGNNIKG